MLNKIRKLKNKKGFTLVELIVVIAIIAILTAVIVPLVGRYSAQATYTTLQDAAQTVSNSANTSLSSATMMGSVCPIETFTGSKTGGSLKVDSTGGTAGTATATASTPATPAAGWATGDGVEKRACGILADALFATLPEGASFYITVSGNTVTGVIYSADSSLTAASLSSTTFERDTAFEKAYRDPASKKAVGISGKYVPAS